MGRELVVRQGASSIGGNNRRLFQVRLGLFVVNFYDSMGTLKIKNFFRSDGGREVFEDE